MGWSVDSSTAFWKGRLETRAWTVQPWCRGIPHSKNGLPMLWRKTIWWRCGLSDWSTGVFCMCGRWGWGWQHNAQNYRHSGRYFVPGLTVAENFFGKAINASTQLLLFQALDQKNDCDGPSNPQDIEDDRISHFLILYIRILAKWGCIEKLTPQLWPCPGYFHENKHQDEIEQWVNPQDR